ncbi:MAG: hypothetical protein ACRC3H_02180 [Lachnospiraceae bacterium]
MNEWMNSDAFKNMDPLKVELIKKAAAQTKGKSGNALAPVLMALITNANKQGVRFTPDEATLIINIMKEGKPAQEQAQMDQMINMVKNVMSKQTGK